MARLQRLRKLKAALMLTEVADADQFLSVLQIPAVDEEIRILRQQQLIILWKRLVILRRKFLIRQRFIILRRKFLIRRQLDS